LVNLNQVDQLGGDLTTQWEQSSRFQLELERMKRMESDLKRDLASRNNQIDELKVEMKMKNTSHLSDLTQINAEKHSLEQEITSIR
jgi:serologically defined colon cancer antigen 8